MSEAKHARLCHAAAQLFMRIDPKKVDQLAWWAKCYRELASALSVCGVQVEKRDLESP